MTSRAMLVPGAVGPLHRRTRGSNATYVKKSARDGIMLVRLPETLKAAVAALVGAAASVTAAPSAASELLALTPSDKFVVAAAIDDMGSLDPAAAYEFSTSDLLHNVYETLLIEGPSDAGRFLPGLAESWEVSGDGRVHSFQIRAGVTFASGNPVTAADAAFSLRRLVKLDMAPASTLTQFGFTPANVTQRIFDDGDRLVLDLPAPIAPGLLHAALTATSTAVVDRESVLENEVSGDLGHAWLSETTAGSGSYALGSFSRGVDYVLTARADHWRGPVPMPRVRVHHVPASETQRALLEAGLIDVARNLRPEDVAALAQNPNIRLQSGLTGEIMYLAANMAHPILSEPAVIEAMRWLVDYHGIASLPGLDGSRIVHQAFLPRGIAPALEDTPFTLDVARARALLEQAGIAPFPVTLLVRDVEDRMKVAQALRESFAAAGITLTITALSGQEVLTRYRNRNHELVLEAWIPEFADPHFNAAAFARNPDNSQDAGASGSLAWRNGYVPGQLGAHVDEAFSMQDHEARSALYRRLQIEHRDTAPFVIMFQMIEQTAMQAQVSGFSSDGVLRQVSFRAVSK